MAIEFAIRMDLRLIAPKKTKTSCTEIKKNKPYNGMDFGIVDRKDTRNEKDNSGKLAFFQYLSRKTS